MEHATPIVNDWRSIERSDGLNLAVLGDPIAHTLSPRMHEAAMKSAGMAGRYLAVHVTADEFDPCVERLQSLGFRGANVTVPHKPRAFAIAMKADSISSKLRAANTLLFSDAIECCNTDVDGISECLPASPGTALVLGAGSAGLAATYALVSKGWTVRVWNRTAQRAIELSRLESVEACIDPDPAGCSLVVNATSIGMQNNDIPPLCWERVDDGTVFFDCVYGTGATAFLERASDRGCAVIDGREMLVVQGALSFRWWTGVDPSRAAMRAAVGL